MIGNINAKLILFSVNKMRYSISMFPFCTSTCINGIFERVKPVKIEFLVILVTIISVIFFLVESCNKMAIFNQPNQLQVQRVVYLNFLEL